MQSTGQLVKTPPRSLEHFECACQGSSTTNAPNPYRLHECYQSPARRVNDFFPNERVTDRRSAGNRSFRPAPPAEIGVSGPPPSSFVGSRNPPRRSATIHPETAPEAG